MRASGGSGSGDGGCGGGDDGGGSDGGNPFWAALCGIAEADYSGSGRKGSLPPPKAPSVAAAAAAAAPRPWGARVSLHKLFRAMAAVNPPDAAAGGGYGGGGDGYGGGGGGGSGAGVAAAETTLLLYSLLQASPEFCAAATVRSDSDALLLPLLRTLYAADAAPAPSWLYVPTIVVLIFTQDAAFDASAFRRIFLPEVAWHRARPLVDASLGSLVLLCVLRALAANLGGRRLGDAYLQQNLCAVLLNVAPHVERLHPYAAQRLVDVLLSVARRCMTPAGTPAVGAGWPAHSKATWVAGAGVAVAPSSCSAKGGAAAAGSPTACGAPSSGLGYGDGDAAGAGSDGGMLSALASEAKDVLLSVIGSCLQPRRLLDNIQLLYALLHEQHRLEPLLELPTTTAVGAAGAAGSVAAVLAHFRELLDAHEGTLSVEEATRLIEHGARRYVTEAGHGHFLQGAAGGGFGGGKANGGGSYGGGGGKGGSSGRSSSGGGTSDGVEDTEAKLTFEEGPEPEAFFVPHAWEVTCGRTPDLEWDWRRIALFSGPRHDASRNDFANGGGGSGGCIEVGHGGGGGPGDGGGPGGGGGGDVGASDGGDGGVGIDAIPAAAAGHGIRSSFDEPVVANGVNDRPAAPARLAETPSGNGRRGGREAVGEGAFLV
ncbi:unnamed protein product [Phaeothamnion confervicola]